VSAAAEQNDLLSDTIADGGSLDEFTVAQWDLAMNINAKGTFLGLKASVDALRRGKPASVVNISSAAGMHGIAGMHAYTASKYAVRGLTKSAALELAGQGVRVNSVHPGSVATPMTAAMQQRCGRRRVPSDGGARSWTSVAQRIARRVCDHVRAVDRAPSSMPTNGHPRPAQVPDPARPTPGR
jgi:NAD(P)-dependent dehydrogenase (short-subunit alcohol dehydrogenase family)